MENKKKPSVLRFVQSHHSFRTPGILFKPEMLEWPIYLYENEILDNVRTNISRKALDGFTQIGPFEAKISIIADLEKQKLILTHRVWGEVSLEDQKILAFSHHTKKEYYPFYSLYEWPELEFNDPEKIITVLNEWTAEQWSDFFRKRIIMQARFLKTKAEAKKGDALELEKRADILLYALSE